MQLRKILSVLSNRHNLRVGLRVFRRVDHPAQYLHFLVFGTPSRTRKLSARTPIGSVEIHLRNHESARTFFSIFMREDYPLESDRVTHMIDVGSNVGLSALYFLPRNPNNKVICVEPDPANLTTLNRTWPLSKSAYGSSLMPAAPGPPVRKTFSHRKTKSTVR